jgi:phosphoribosyl-AMP cyclohydrolase / phosphoribosyl-ATP pyrophosphohydrolase
VPVTLDLDALDFGKGGGRVTIVSQDVITGVVLMVAHADRVALARTIETGEMHYTSRTRGLWHKGATSGNRQRVVSLTADCDGDAILARVEPMGPACHTGMVSCFGDVALANDALASLDQTIARRAATVPTSGDRPSYTRRLLNDRNLRLKKLGEEVAELVAACADADVGRSADEAADVIYHTLVALHGVGANFDAVRKILAVRAQMAPPPNPIP